MTSHHHEELQTETGSDGEATDHIQVMTVVTHNGEMFLKKSKETAAQPDTSHTHTHTHTHTPAGSLLPLAEPGGGCGIDQKHQQQLYDFTLSLELITIHCGEHTHTHTHTHTHSDSLINANLCVDVKRLNPLL